jgi:hypothetical protein
MLDPSKRIACHLNQIIKSICFAIMTLSLISSPANAITTNDVVFIPKSKCKTCRSNEKGVYVVADAVPKGRYVHGGDFPKCSRDPNYAAIAEEMGQIISAANQKVGFAVTTAGKVVNSTQGMGGDIAKLFTPYNGGNWSVCKTIGIALPSSEKVTRAEWIYYWRSSMRNLEGGDVCVKLSKPDLKRWVRCTAKAGGWRDAQLMRAGGGTAAIGVFSNWSHKRKRQIILRMYVEE